MCTVYMNVKIRTATRFIKELYGFVHFANSKFPKSTYLPALLLLQRMSEKLSGEYTLSQPLMLVNNIYSIKYVQSNLTKIPE